MYHICLRRLEKYQQILCFPGVPIPRKANYVLIGVNILLCIMVMELIGKKISKEDVLRNMTYADDVHRTTESNHEEKLEMWKKVFKKPHDTM